MVERAVRLLWTLVSVAGAAYALANWRDAALDYRALKALPDYRPDGPRAVVAHANIRREQLRLVSQIAFTAIGAQSLILPPPPPPPHKGRIIAIAGIMIGQLALVLNDVLDRTDRRRAIAAPGHPKRRKGDPQ